MFVTLKIEKTITEGTTLLFNVSATITDSQDIDSNLFVYLTETDEYSHIATNTDIYRYANTMSQALIDGKGYYRKNYVILSFTSQHDADVAAETIKSRINLLVTSWDTGNPLEYTGTETVTYEGAE